MNFNANFSLMVCSAGTGCQRVSVVSNKKKLVPPNGLRSDVEYELTIVSQFTMSKKTRDGLLLEPVGIVFMMNSSPGSEPETLNYKLHTTNSKLETR